MVKYLIILLSVCTTVNMVAHGDVLSEAEEATPWFVGASGGVLLPGNGNSLRRAAEVTVRGGCYLTDNFALELSGVCDPSVVSKHGGSTTLSGGAAAGVFHLTGWSAYDRLFGCERLDPFVTLGVAARFATHHVFAEDSHRTALGPQFGVGAFYHLTEAWSVRGAAYAQVCCDSPCGMLYGVTLGLNYSFGGL